MRGIRSVIGYLRALLTSMWGHGGHLGVEQALHVDPGVTLERPREESSTPYETSSAMREPVWDNRRRRPLGASAE